MTVKAVATSIEINKYLPTYLHKKYLLKLCIGSSLLLKCVNTSSILNYMPRVVHSYDFTHTLHPIRTNENAHSNFQGVVGYIS